MKKPALLSLAILLPLFSVFGQETHYFFGTSYNETQMAGGPIFIELAVHPDNTISGYLDADPYPGQTAFCGAGDITGTLNQNRLSFSYISMDPDPGCGFDFGYYIEYECTVADDFSAITGDFTIYTSINGSLHSDGNVYLRAEKGCADISGLQADYQSKVGTPEAAYAHQYLCIASSTCDEYNQTGDGGWAGGFVKYLFDYMETHNEGNTGLDITCDDLLFFPNSRCLQKAGDHHFNVELRPAFFSYCDAIEDMADITRWANDHENFLSNAVSPCFNELIDAGELNSPQALFAKQITMYKARKLREDAQAYCTNQMNNGNIFSLRSLLPEPPAYDALYSEDLNSISEMDITTDSFFLAVGGAYQIQAILNDGSGQDVTNGSTGTEYHLSVDNTIATISDDGLISVLSTNEPLVNSRADLLVYAKNGDKLGIGQFAIYDADTDEDLLADSYESKIGLYPNLTTFLSYDTDSDGLGDFFEALARTNPLLSDTDSDGFGDSFELTVRTDPLDASSTPISITTGIPSIESFDAGVEVFPSPFTTQVSIRFAGHLLGKGLSSLSVYDVNGRKLYEEQHDRVEKENYVVELSNLAKGIYLLQVVIEGQSITRKIVKR